MYKIFVLEKLNKKSFLMSGYMNKKVWIIKYNKKETRVDKRNKIVKIW